MPQCLHCHVRRALHGHRGLCQPCFADKTIRQRYPKSGTRGDGDRHLDPPLPDKPTAALPGTPEKVGVLTDRARHWRRLWHPRDAKAD
jgi:hypothetical protein